MNKAIRLIGLMAFIVGIGSCSDTTVPEKTTQQDIVGFQVKVNGDIGINSRAVTYSYYPNSTTLSIGVISNVSAIDKALDGKRTTTLTVNGDNENQTLTSDPVMYWNDMGGSDADVNMWGVYTSTQKVSVSDRGALSWQVGTDQSKGVLPYDLHWSNNVKNLRFKETAQMVFTHAMSKITMNLTVGEGYSAQEAATTLITYKGNLTKTEANAYKEEIINPSTVADITPAVLSNFNGGMKASYEAIVVPSREIKIDDVMAVINIGANTYYVKSKEDRTFESGKNYIYNVSVKKSGVAFVSSTIADWEEVEGSADSKIIFTAGEGNGGANGIGPNALNNATDGFDIFISNDNSNYDADADNAGTQPATSVKWVPAQGTEGTPGYVPGHWENENPIYWNNDKDDTYFRALSPTGADNSNENGNFTLAAGENDYIWGTSGTDAIQPSTGSVALNFQHIMSKVVITLITTDGDDAVDLSTINKQTISNIATTAQFNIGTGTYAPFTAANYGDYTLNLKEIEGSNKKKYSCEFYAFPQKLRDDAKVNVSVGVDPFNFFKELNKIMANNTYITEWEAGKRYVYTIQLKKTEKKFTAMLTDWNDVITEESKAEL